MSELGVRRKEALLLCANEPHRSTPPGSQREGFWCKSALWEAKPFPAHCASSRGGVAQISDLSPALLHLGIIASPAGAVVRQHRGKLPGSPSSEVQRLGWHQAAVQ